MHFFSLFCIKKKTKKKLLVLENLGKSISTNSMDTESKRHTYLDLHSYDMQKSDLSQWHLMAKHSFILVRRTKTQKAPSPHKFEPFHKDLQPLLTHANNANMYIRYVYYLQVCTPFGRKKMSDPHLYKLPHSHKYTPHVKKKKPVSQCLVNTHHKQLQTWKNVLN